MKSWDVTTMSFAMSGGLLFLIGLALASAKGGTPWWDGVAFGVMTGSALGFAGAFVLVWRRTSW